MSETDAKSNWQKHKRAKTGKQKLRPILPVQFKKMIVLFGKKKLDGKI